MDLILDISTKLETVAPENYLDGDYVVELERNHYFNGDVSTLINRLLRYKDSTSSTDRMLILNYVDTLIRLALKYKNSLPATKENLKFFLEIVKNCRNIYHRARNKLQMTSESISYLEHLLQIEDFKNTHIKYDKDRLTLNGILESRMSDSVQALLELSDDRTLLLIPIGNGGIFSALELSTFIQENINTNSLILPIKFSRRKDKDTNPTISEVEIDLIKYYIEELGAVPVIWDDDVVSANTITDFFRYISNLTKHDEFRLMGGYVRGNQYSNSDNALNMEMIANSSLNLEKDKLPK